jgi:hypothetical protein
MRGASTPPVRRELQLVGKTGAIDFVAVSVRVTAGVLGFAVDRAVGWACQVPRIRVAMTGVRFVAAVDDVEEQSQQQHQRFYNLFGANPATGEGFTDVGNLGRQVGDQSQQARSGVVGSNFSASVVPALAGATTTDHVPFTDYARTAATASEVSDASARVNIRGAADVLANSRNESAQFAAIPDRNSPEGMLAALNTISNNQAKSLDTVQQSATTEQQLGQRAAGNVQMAGFQHAPLPRDPTTTTSPTPDPPQCKPEDQAKLIKKFVELNLKNDQLTKDITAYDQKYPQGHAFNMNDPVQAAEYERGQELARERAQLIRDYGELLKDATTCGALEDPKTHDILWPDGTRTTLGPPK